MEGLSLLNKPSTDAQVVVLTPPEPKSKLAEGPNSTTHLAKRNASPSPAEPSRKIIRGQPRSLALPKISKGENTAGSDLIERKESLWDTFKKIFKYDLAGTVSICIRHSGCCAVWAVQQYPSMHADRILEILYSTRHKNMVSVMECFQTSDSLYTLGKHYPLMLDHVVACKAFPDQQQLAAIISQVWLQFYVDI